MSSFDEDSRAGGTTPAAGPGPGVPALTAGPGQAHNLSVTGADAFSISDLPEKIAARIIVNTSTGCWEWQGPLFPKGYGRVSWQGKAQRVHRVVYVLLVEQIPDGLTLDHVKARGCESKACCWPAHLEPVTSRENILRGDSPSARAARKTHCPKGHPYDDDNTYRNRDGSRRCRTCQAARAKGTKRTSKSRSGRGARYWVRIKLLPEIAQAATRMAHEDGITVSPWMSALIAAEIERRSAFPPGAQHE